MVTNHTRQYTGGSPRTYGNFAGIRLLSAIEGTGTDPFSIAQATQLGAPLGFSPRHTITLLHRLETAGWITRIKRGVYALNDPVTRLPRAHPFAIGTALVTPAAVSHWSALQHWGLTEQVPLAVFVSSPTRINPPADAGATTGERPVWGVAGTRYEVVAIARARFFGIKQVWVNERNQVPIFDGERALLDAFHHFHIFGSLSTAMEILDKHLADIDVDRLVRYALQLKVTAVIKRIGWALEHVDVPLVTLEPLRVHPARGESPLDPGRPSRGHHNREWSVIENLHDS